MQEDLHSERLNAGQRTYFFDIKETPNGDRYLNIKETKLNKEGERERRDIRIFEDHLDEFLETLQKAVEFLKK